MKAKTMLLSILVSVWPVFLTSCDEGHVSENENTEIVEPEDEEPSAEEILAAERKALMDSLAFGGKYVSRTWDDYSDYKTPYLCVGVQKEYYFHADGGGVLVTYLMDDTDRGYVKLEDSIVWSVSETKPFSLKIRERENVTISLEEVRVTDKELSSKNGDWLKEINPWPGLCKDDVISYSIDGMIASHGHSSYGEPLVWVTPATLTVKTIRGTMRFIRSHCSDCIVGYRQPYTLKGDNFEPMDCEIYFSVCEDETSFYEIFLMKEPLSFVDKYPRGSNTISFNFDVGMVLGNVVVFNSNGEEYIVQN